MFLCAGLIADIYNDDRLIHVGQVLAVTFLLNGASAQYRSSLQRDLRFVLVTVADVLGIAVGIIVGVGLALAHYGYWAIVWDNVAQAAATLVFVVVVSRWLPRRYDRHTSIRRFAVFGVNVLLAQIIGYGGRNADSITIGIRFGAAPLGIYNRAFDLLTLPLNQLNAPSTRVATPVLSRLQNKRKRYSDYLVTGQTVLLHTTLLVLAAMAALAAPGVHLVLGEQWLPAIPLFQILAIAGSFQTAGYVTYWVFLSKGLTRESLYLSLVSRPLGIAFIVIGSHWGVTGVAWGYAAGAALNWPLSMWWISRCSDAPVPRLLWNGLRCELGYAAAALTTYAVVHACSGLPSSVQILIGFAVLFSTVAVEALIFPPFRQDLRLLRRAAKALR